jgi:polar amino acid transport system ATP-binding protein
VQTEGRRKMVEMKGVFKYFGSLKALDNVSLDVFDGEKVVIIGPSGSGKSTLLRSINRLEEVNAGTIIVDGFDIYDANVNINKVREEVGMVFQSFNVFPHKTVLQNLMLAQLVVRKRGKEEAAKIAYGLLDKVGIREKANVYPTKLSGGQQDRKSVV